MPFKLINAGGSLTFSAVVLAAVWAVKSLTAAARQRQKAAANSSTQQAGHACKYGFTITTTALSWLLQMQAIPHFVIDVRKEDEIIQYPLPDWASLTVNIPEPRLASALTPPFSAWTDAAAAIAAEISAPAPPMFMGTEEDADSEDYLPSLLPTPEHLLVLLGRDEQQQAAAAAAAAAAGFDRVAVLAGGVDVLRSGAHQGLVAVDLAPPVMLLRDGLALLLDLAPLPEELYQQLSDSLALQQQQQQQPGSPSLVDQGAAAAAAAAAMEGPGGIGVEAAAAAAAPAPMLRGRRVLVLDVRRHDERTLYGAIPGALHLPVDELPSALRLSRSQFRHRYHFDQPGRDDVLVMQSRLDSRARWASQLARDAGWKHVIVFAGGVCHWQVSLAVQVYPAYQQWQLPPDPEPFVPTPIDVAVGVAQLQQLGLLGLLLEQHAEHHPPPQQQ